MSRAGSAEKQARILVVDDTATLRQMACDALESAGFAVQAAEDGERALALFEAQPPDLVLLDVQMPGLDGFGVCERIRRAPVGSHVPVLIVTSLDDVESVRRAYEAGATDFITKPLNWELVVHRIRYALRTGRLVAELERSRERLAKAQHSAKLGNWELHLATRALSCSTTCRQILGVEGSEEFIPIGKLIACVHPDDREPLLRAIGRAAQEGTPIRLDHRIVRPDQEQRHVHTQADVVYGEAGEAVELCGTIQDVTDWRRAEKEVEFLAYHDSLTRLGNRRLFRERVGTMLDQAQTREDPKQVGVLFVDLDHFKRINDTLGHEKGDWLLQRVADRLRACVRGSDQVFRSVEEESSAVSRFGGDEFVISLCAVRNAGEAGNVATRILEVLSRPFEIADQELVVGASIGIAVSPEHGEDVDTLLRNADAAMYRAKQQGRNAFLFYDSSMNQLARKSLQLESGLRRAIGGGELVLHYQPKIELASGRITGFEALVRWQHPELGMVPPNEFIHVAEQAGLIGQLGEYVLRRACQQARTWRELGFSPLRVAVNLSAHQFQTEELAGKVGDILSETPLSARCLDLEITESTMMENKEVATRVLRALKGIGITVSLDDFGTGYSSLSYLKGFPIDTVKIDRAFVRDLVKDPDDAAITAAIISMAQTLNLHVVAEGVETQEQLEYLRRRGCQEVQGFFFSRPLPADEATELLRRNFQALEAGQPPW